MSWIKLNPLQPGHIFWGNESSIQCSPLTEFFRSLLSAVYFILFSFPFLFLFLSHTALFLESSVTYISDLCHSFVF